MGRKSASVRREEILAATVEEIEETGLRTLRVADVAQRLGLSPSLVIYHFVTKEALVAAAFAHAGQNDLYRARRIAAAKTSVRARLGDLLRWYMPTGTTRSWKIWIDGWSAALFDDDLKATFSVLDKEWKTILSGLILSGWRTGELARSERTGESLAAESSSEHSEAVDAMSRATRILAYMDGLSIQNVLNSERVDKQSIVAWIDQIISDEVGDSI